VSYLYICNTSCDSLSIVDIESFQMTGYIALFRDTKEKVGPHGLCRYKNYILTANNYSNSLSIVEPYIGRELESYFIGMHCNDIVTKDNTAYIICGESNSLVSFDMEQKRIAELLPCGSNPHSIDMDKERKELVICSMESQSITLVDTSDFTCHRQIRVGDYPTSALFSIDGQKVMVCESNLGTEGRGSVAFFAVKGCKLINRVPVGNSPVAMCCDKSYCYVSNYGEGSISIIDINGSREIKRINVGGMPRGILKYGDYIYVGDQYKNLLLKIHLRSEIKKAIPLGGEPTGMLLI